MFAISSSTSNGTTTPFEVNNNGSVVIGSLTGPLQAISGVVSATTSIGVLYGGTGQTSFGQGWLGINNSGAFISSTSPTVAYLTATSTKASQFVNASTTNLTVSNILNLSGSVADSGGSLGSFSKCLGAGLGDGVLWTSCSNPTYWSLAGGGPNIYINIANVGIGTSSPTFALSVEGTSTLGNAAVAGYFVGTTTATSTFAGGHNITSGCYAIGGTCLQSATTSLTIAQTYGTAQTGNITLGTTTGATNNGLTTGIYITNTGGSFTFNATSSGILTAAGGGTGISNPTAAGILLGSYAGGGWQQLATSSLGITAFSTTSAAYWGSQQGYDTFAYPFTPSTNFAATDQATTGIAWFQNGFNASSTSQIAYASTTMITATTASTTNLNVSGSTVLQSLAGVSTRCLQVGTDGSVSASVAACGTGGGGSLSSWATTTSQVSGEIVNYSLNGSDILAIGNTSTTTAKFWFDPNALTSYLSGNVGIGTTSPYDMLSVAGEVVANDFYATSTTATSTFAGGLNVGGGALQYSFGSGVTSISNLQLGNLSFDTDAGTVSWVDLPLSSAAAGVAESYTATIASSPLLTVYAQSNGSGGIQNGAVGIGTTSPYSLLSVAGQVVAQNFVATSSVASQFPYASTTMISSSFASTTNLYVFASSTLNSFTFTNATGTAATTTSFYATTASSTNLYATNGNVGTLSANSLSLASALAISSGGTGLSSTPNYGQLLLGNALSGYTLSATSSLGLLGSSTVSSLTNNYLPKWNSNGTFANSLIYDNGTNVGIGTTTPNWSLEIASTSANGTFQGQLALTDSGAGANLKHWLFSSEGGNFYLGTSSDAYSTSTMPDLTITSNGLFGIASTSPYLQLGVNGGIAAGYYNADATTSTSTFQGGFNLGNGSFTYDWNTGSTSASYFEMGNENFAQDSGVITWVDMPISGTSANGTPMSYSADLAGTPVLTIYGVSDATNYVASTSVGVGTTTPYGVLSVAASSTNPAFVVSQYTNTTSGPLASFFSSTTEAIRFSNTGDAYFGTTTTSATNALSIQNRNSDTNVLSAYNSGGAPLMALSNSGYLGIGTTTPYALLTLSATSTTGVQPLFVVATTTTLGVTPAFQIDQNGLLTMSTPGATSTITGGLYVNGTLRATNSYVGDLIFGNGFSVTEAPISASSTQGLLVRNQNGQDVHDRRRERQSFGGWRRLFAGNPMLRQIFE